MYKLVSLLYAFFNKSKRYRRRDFGRIGIHSIIGADCDLVPYNIFLDDYTIIQNGNNFISYKGKLVLKKYSVIASGCIIVPSRHIPAVGLPFYYAAVNHIGDEDTTITVEEDCWVGAGSILLPGCTLGRGCIVGAGSVVTKDIPPYAVVAGAPAKIIAVKFSLKDILEHEKIYDEKDRMSKEFLVSLFDRYYSNIRVMSSEHLSECRLQE